MVLNWMKRWKYFWQMELQHIGCEKWAQNISRGERSAVRSLGYLRNSVSKKWEPKLVSKLLRPIYSVSVRFGVGLDRTDRSKNNSKKKKNPAQRFCVHNGSSSWWSTISVSAAKGTTLCCQQKLTPAKPPRRRSSAPMGHEDLIFELWRQESGEVLQAALWARKRKP